jgi:hypothetical protein
MNEEIKEVKEYCYSSDNESFSYSGLGELIQDLDVESDDELLGCTYWRGDKLELLHADCIDIDSFLEMCDDRASDEIGEIYDPCFTDVTPDEKQELHDKILDWCKKRVNLRFWKVRNTVELKITEEDIKEYK